MTLKTGAGGKSDALRASKNPPPRKTSSIQQKLLRAALAICVCVMVAAAVFLVRYYYHAYMQWRHERDARAMYEEIISSRLDNLWPEPSYTDIVHPGSSGGGGTEGEDAGSAEEETPQQRERRILEDMEVLGKTVFADFLTINGDFRGMFLIDGLISPIPYVHSKDNAEYLSLDFNGRNSPLGTIFLDAWNDRLLTDRNNVLYAHNYRSGQMFAPLLRYKQAETFASAPVVRLDSLTGETVWVIFAAYITEPDWGYIRQYPDQASFAGFIDEILARSLYITDVDVTSDDRILTMSTCDQDFENMRFVVHARKLRPGEEIPETVTATRNPDQKPYNLTNSRSLSDIVASRTAITLNTAMNRHYFYQPRNGGIDWYTGNQNIVQGVFNNYNGPITESSFIAVAYDANNNQDARMLYVAVDGFDGQQGIHLLTSRFLSGNLTYDSSSGLITPPGVDARYPAMHYDGTAVWLLYAVAHGDGEDIYRRRLADGRASGDPELLLTLPPGTGSRPLGYYSINGFPVLFWHDTATQAVRAAWLPSAGSFADPFADPFSGTFAVPLTGSADRVTFYGITQNGSIRASTEKDGAITLHTLSPEYLPPPPAGYDAPAPPGPDAEPETGQDAPPDPEPSQDQGTEPDQGQEQEQEQEQEQD